MLYSSRRNRRQSCVGNKGGKRRPKTRTRFACEAKRVRERIRFAALAVFVRIDSFTEATDPRARKLGSNRRVSGH
jgi:hypothetical protein